MRKSDTVTDLFAGLIKLRAKLKQPSKDAENPFFKSDYVTLEGVQKAIDEAKEGTGIDYSQFVETNENGLTGVATMIYSDKGEYIITDPLYLKPAKNDPQGNGSVITYSRRYQLSSLFGISSDIDDDGNQATNPQQGDQRNNYQRKNNYYSNRNNAPQRSTRQPTHNQQKSSAEDERRKTYQMSIESLANTLGMDYKTADSDVKSMARKKPEWANAKNVSDQLAICINVANELGATAMKDNDAKRTA